MSPKQAIVLGMLVWMVFAPTLSMASNKDVNDDDEEGDNGCPKDGGNSICPVDDDDYTRDGVYGAIVDPASSSKGKGYLLYHFFNDKKGYSGCKAAQTCQNLCKTWPLTPKGFRLSPVNGQSGLCSHWSWNGDSDCYLFGCGVCGSSKSFSKDARFGSKKYVSGGGPGLRYCSGGVKGDPHFHGADDSNFDFTGVPGTSYCLISDSHIHVNAHYGGRYDRWGNETSKPLTWIRQIGILWGHHTVKLAVREGARWEYDHGYMASMEVDGEPVSLAQEGDSLTSAGGAIRIRWVAAKRRDADDLVDVYEVNVGDVLLVRLTLRPEVAILRTSTDAVVHFDVEFPMADLSEGVHGVLGQTYRSDHKGRISHQALEHDDVLGVDVVKGRNAEGFLDGEVEDYASTSLLKADCKVARFVRATAREEEMARSATASWGSVASSTLPRKILGPDGILAI